MDIIAISYKNIGPFFEKTISINFKKGKFLIKAPIGTGKSFLFFDGPMFGLYKQSSRGILNRKSKEGFIKIVFEASGDLYFLTRHIKSTKTLQESVQSRIYKIGEKNINLLEKNLPNIINLSIDLESFIELDEEISFKSQIELQKTLETIISPREIIQNTNLLMQDSENIFEAVPSERINVFKNIFGLIGIDEAKDIIGEKRKETQLNIKIKADTSNYDQNIQDNIKQISNITKYLDGIENLFIDELIKSEIKSFLKERVFEDLSLFGEKINIENLDGSIFSESIFLQTNTAISKIKDSYQGVCAKLDVLKENKNSTEERIKTNQKEQKELEIKIEEIKGKLNIMNETNLEYIKEKKLNLLKKEGLLIDGGDLNIIGNYGYKVKDIFEAQKLIEELTAEGKNIKTQIENIELKIESINKEKDNIKANIIELELKPGTQIFEQFQNNIQSQKKNFLLEIKNIDVDLEKIQNKINTGNEEIKNINKQISDLDSIIGTHSNYYCKKIEGQCLYIKEIKKETIENFNSQIELLNNKKANILKEFEINDYNNVVKSLEIKKNQIYEKIELLNNSPELFFKDFIKEIENKKNQIIKQLQDKGFEENLISLSNQKQSFGNQLLNIKNFFKEFDRKTINNNILEINKINAEIKQIDKQIFEIENQIKLSDSLKQQLNTLLVKKESIETSLLQYETDLEKNNKQIILKQELLNNYNIKLVDEVEIHIKQLINYFENISKIIREYKNTQLNIKQLQEDEKILNDLFQIFSKELMLVVLQEFLPSLQDVINNLLSNIVDYSLKFDLTKKSTDKLELDININDEKGLRNIKSLSGGQKTILRIIWILAISSMLKVKFLFLDETINNIDQETILKVGELIDEFLKTNEMKFYIVTHSIYIQQMNIWDEIIELNNI